MDAKAHVKRDILQFLRTYKASTMSMNFGPLEIHIRGYNAKWKDVLQPAIEELVVEELLERHRSKIVLTAKGKEKVFS